MKEKMSRNPTWLFLALSGLSGLGFVMQTQNPDNFITILLFFAALFLTLFSVLQFAFNIVRRSLLWSGGAVLMLFLRYLGLREWYYPLLITAILISLEFLYHRD